mmetsp:Transcript_24847/g.69673  ORF Transcript_24847/g.69673 Transcript_24847/m.69673 type:complete len:181 (-) Transcript_24847:122-664(-)
MDFMGGGSPPPAAEYAPPAAEYAPPAAMPADAGAFGDAMGYGGEMPPPSAMGFSGGGGARAMPEMNALREWEEKHSQQLEETARAEEAKKKDRRQSASDELSQWYQDRDGTTKKRLATNRSEEKTTEAARLAAMQPGANPWERVVDLIDTNAKTGDGCRDTGRMRALLIQLKSSPVIPAS